MNVRIPEQNLVLISGRLTRDPDMRYTQKGLGVCSFDLAVNRRYKDQATGEWKDDTTFVPVSVWGPKADRCKERARKGVPAFVEGRLVNSEYTDKTGQKRKVMRVVARRVQFLATAESGGQHEPAAEAAETETAADKASASDMDEVPF